MEPVALRLIRLMHITPKPDHMPCRVTGKGYMDVNRISGYIPGKMVFFLMQVLLGWSLASVMLLHAASGPSLLRLSICLTTCSQSCTYTFGYLSPLLMAPLPRNHAV